MVTTALYGNISLCRQPPTTNLSVTDDKLGAVYNDFDFDTSSLMYIIKGVYMVEKPPCSI